MVTIARRGRYISQPPAGAVLDHADPVLRGLQGWWDFREGSGSILRDSSGRRAHGDLNTANRVTQHGQQGIQTDGVSDAPYTGITEALNFAATDPHTLLLHYASTDRAAWDHQRANSLDRRGWNLQTTGNIAYYMLRGHGGLTSDRIFVQAAGAWNDGGEHTIVATYDGSQNASGVRMYGDGEELSLTTLTNGLTGVTTWANPGRLGYLYGGSLFYYAGTYYTVAAWNRVLSPGEVQELYVAPRRGYVRRTFISLPADAAPEPSTTVVHRAPWATKPPRATLLNRAHWMNKDLRALWTFQEGADDRTRDLAGLPRVDDIVSPSWARNALVFNSTSTRVNIPATSLPTTTDFSVFAVIDGCTKNNSATLISNNMNQQGRFAFSAVQNSSNLIPNVFLGWNTGNLLLQGSTPVNDGAYHTLAMSRAGTTWSIYVDGVREAQVTYNKNITADETAIGCTPYDGGDRFFQGDFLHLAVYDRALTDGEQMKLHAAPWALYRGRLQYVRTVITPPSLPTFRRRPSLAGMRRAMMRGMA